ncbi:unnamed protein product, partial [Arctia plantaginis]
MWWKPIVFVNIFIINSIISQDVGEKCMPNNQVFEGTCKEVSQCEAAMQAIRNKRNHQFGRCGFSGFEEVVCCPHTTNKFGDNIDRKTGDNSGDNRTGNNSNDKTRRIAERECRKIAANSIAPLDLHILGGEAASLGEFPHMVALGYDRGNGGFEFDCGGSVLSNTYVLSAAHCVDTLDRIEPTIIRAGVVEIGGKNFNSESDVRIAEIVINPRYTRKEKYHDLALLRLEKPLQFTSTLNAICLETNDEDPTEPLTITGWGKVNNARDTRSTTLLKANVTVVQRGNCTESYTNWRKLPSGISPDQLCAGDPEGIRDTCQGDSGGPLVITSEEGQGKNRLVGVTSFGRGCGSSIPGVYTRVSR